MPFLYMQFFKLKACSGSRSDNQLDEVITDESTIGGASGDMCGIIDESKMYTDEPTIWVCLQCGFQVCTLSLLCRSLLLVNKASVKLRS